MIAYINGVIIHISGNSVIVNTTTGIGYELFVTPSALREKQIDDEISLFTYLQVRDDAHILFGFANLDEKQFFTLLLSVAGVGPKTAFSIVSHISFEEAVSAVRTQNVTAFSTISGIGKKTAMKIMLELSQKFKENFSFKQTKSPEDQTALEALIELGYKRQEAESLLAKLDKKLTLEEKIQAVLRLTH